MRIGDRRFRPCRKGSHPKIGPKAQPRGNAYVPHTNFPYTSCNLRQKDLDMTNQRTSAITRLLLAAVVIVFGAYWAGARWGQRQPIGVGADPHNSGAARELSAASAAARDAALTDEEAINVRVYRQVSPAVANILTKATEYDFFMDPVPVEGAGSGFVIDEKS